MSASAGTKLDHRPARASPGISQPGNCTRIPIPADDSPQALYTFTVGDGFNPLAPRNINLVDRSRQPFVNTSVRFLNGFDYLYDADGGFVGLRWTGHASQTFGKVAPISPSN